MAQKKTKTDSSLSIKDIPIFPVSVKNGSKILGSGSFATVYLVKSKGKHYAVKKPNMDLAEDDMSDIKKEIVMCWELKNCEFIASLIGINEYKKQIVCVFELCSNDVNSFYKIRNFSGAADEKSDEIVTQSKREEFIKYVLYCTAKALEYMHNKGICHRDIKLENMLIGSDGTVKLTDQGFTRNMGDHSSTWCGTDGYMAMEIATKPMKNKGKGFYYNGLIADIWSLGVSGISFFSNVHGILSKEFDMDDDEFDDYGSVYERIIEIKNKVKTVIKNDLLIEFIDGTVVLEPNDRQTAKAVVALFDKGKYTTIKGDLKFVSKECINARINNIEFGKKGKNCCTCGGPFKMLRLKNLTEDNDSKIQANYGAGAVCDGCEKDIKGNIWHCENTVFHGDMFDFCDQCVKSRNKKLSRNWKNRNTLIMK
eukprot:362756_1